MIPEATSDMTDLAFSAGNNGARFIHDNRLHVRFFHGRRLHNGDSKEKGRPIYHDCDYIEIMTPGNKDSIVRRPMTELDRRRFAQRYQQWKAQTGDDGEQLDGTPLEEWPGVTRGQVEELRHYKVRTVEQLAGMPDSAVQNFAGGSTLKQKAKTYLESSENLAAAEALSTAEKRMDQMQQQLDLLAAENQSLKSSDSVQQPADYASALDDSAKAAETADDEKPSTRRRGRSRKE